MRVKTDFTPAFSWVMRLAGLSAIVGQVLFPVQCLGGTLGIFGAGAFSWGARLGGAPDILLPATFCGPRPGGALGKSRASVFQALAQSVILLAATFCSPRLGGALGKSRASVFQALAQRSAFLRERFLGHAAERHALQFAHRGCFRPGARAQRAAIFVKGAFLLHAHFWQGRFRASAQATRSATFWWALSWLRRLGGALENFW